MGPPGRGDHPVWDCLAAFVGHRACPTRQTFFFSASRTPWITNLWKGVVAPYHSIKFKPNIQFKCQVWTRTAWCLRTWKKLVAKHGDNQNVWEMIAHVAAVLMVPVVVRLEGPGRKAGTQTDPAEFPPRFCALAEAAYDDSKFMLGFPCFFSSWFVLPWFCAFCFFAEFFVIPWVVRFFAQQQQQPQQLTTTNNNTRNNGHKSQLYQSRRKATKIGATVRAARDMRCGRFLCWKTHRYRYDKNMLCCSIFDSWEKWSVPAIFSVKADGRNVLRRWIQLLVTSCWCHMSSMQQHCWPVASQLS